MLAILLSLALCASMVMPAGAVYAEEKKTGSEKGVFDEIAKKLAEKKDPFAFRNSSSMRLNAGKTYPQAFDLRDVDGESYVTPVKFQNPFGTCWGFAAIAAAESSILGSGISRDDGYDANTLDLSEKHLVNFTHRPIADKTDPQYGEGVYFDESVAGTLEEKFNDGGFPFYATSLFSSGMGPNLEDRALPAAAPAGTPADIYEYHGLSKEPLYRGWPAQKFCYTDQDDWSIPEELRFSQSYVLKESFMLPSPAHIEYDEKTEENYYTYDEEATNAFKDVLMDKHAIEIAFTADSSMPDDDKEGIYISKNWAHYTYEIQYATHAVTIVGWDDNYPKENFVEGHQPPENGAWLVKNSWGSGEREFPNRGYGTWGLLQGQDKAPYKAVSDVHTGYFWISYYDQTIQMAEALDFEESNVGKEYYVDQHDYMPMGEVQTADLEEPIRMSNVFTAEQCQSLEGISSQTAAPGTELQYSVYLLNKNYEDPEDGLKVASGVRTYEYGGFHKIKLDEPVIVQKGQPYSIIVTQKTPENLYNINIPSGASEDLAKMTESVSWVKGVINEGESFVEYKDKWYDYTGDFRESIFGVISRMLSFDNFPIKGYSKKLPDCRIRLSDDVLDLSLREGADHNYVRASVSGTEVEIPEDAVISWESIDNGGICSIEPRESDPTICDIKALRAGTGYVAVTIDGVGTQILKVVVSKKGKFADYDMNMSYTYEEEVEIYDTSLNRIEDISGFKIVSEDPSVVKVKGKKIKGVKVGKTRVICTEIATGAEAVINIKVVKAEQVIKVKGRTVSVSYSKLKKADQKIKVKKALKVKENAGKLSYKKNGGSKKITVNRKTGMITVKKGLKKGKYRIKVRVTAAGSRNFTKAVETRTVTIKVR